MQIIVKQKGLFCCCLWMKQVTLLRKPEAILPGVLIYWGKKNVLHILAWLSVKHGCNLQSHTRWGENGTLEIHFLYYGGISETQNKSVLLPWLCSSVGWALSCAGKHCQFNSGQRTWARWGLNLDPWLGYMQKAANWWFIFTSMFISISPSSFLSL